MGCIYNKNDFCTNNQCPMCTYYCPVPNTEGVCKHEDREEDVYMLTPKCIFESVLLDYVELNNCLVDAIWEDFLYQMTIHGYIEIEEEEESEAWQNE